MVQRNAHGTVERLVVCYVGLSACFSMTFHPEDWKIYIHSILCVHKLFVSSPGLSHESCIYTIKVNGYEAQQEVANVETSINLANGEKICWRQ